ncbi:MAG: hypothetical protein J2P33_10485, partial [Actinobacteria bacterium]|nr:hypothetical protein [Actinomycetota bacterium]
LGLPGGDGPGAGGRGGLGGLSDALTRGGQGLPMPPGGGFPGGLPPGLRPAGPGKRGRRDKGK